VKKAAKGEKKRAKKKAPAKALREFSLFSDWSAEVEAKKGVVAAPYTFFPSVRMSTSNPRRCVTIAAGQIVYAWKVYHSILFLIIGRLQYRWQSLALHPQKKLQGLLCGQCVSQVTDSVLLFFLRKKGAADGIAFTPNPLASDIDADGFATLKINDIVHVVPSTTAFSREYSDYTGFASEIRRNETEKRKLRGNSARSAGADSEESNTAKEEVRSF
jgi:hypothetical protein